MAQETTAQQVYDLVLAYDENRETYARVVDAAVAAKLISKGEPKFRPKRETVETIRNRAKRAGATDTTPETTGPLTFEELLRLRHLEVFAHACKHRRVNSLPADTLSVVLQWAEDAAATAFERDGVRWTGTGSVDERAYLDGFDKRCRGRALNLYDVSKLFRACYSSYIELLTLRRAASVGPLTGGTGRRSGHDWHEGAWE